MNKGDALARNIPFFKTFKRGGGAQRGGGGPIFPPKKNKRTPGQSKGILNLCHQAVQESAHGWTNSPGHGFKQALWFFYDSEPGEANTLQA